MNIKLTGCYKRNCVYNASYYSYTNVMCKSRIKWNEYYGCGGQMVERHLSNTLWDVILAFR